MRFSADNPRVAARDAAALDTRWGALYNDRALAVLGGLEPDMPKQKPR
jgi:hypothetical protein